MKLRAAILASGKGSNFGALVDRVARAAEADWEPSLLVVDRPGAGALALARDRGISAATIAPDDDPVRFSRNLLARLEESGVDLVFLAGYLRLVPSEVVRRFQGRMLNLHPALLPSFGGRGMYGLRVHEAVLEAGVRVTGVTIHFVDEEYDRGRIFAQWPVPVLPGDTPMSLQERIQGTEHVLYPAAAAALAGAVRRGEHPVAPPREGHYFELTDHLAEHLEP